MARMNRTICLLYGNSSVNGETETLGGIIFVRAYKNLEKIVEKIPALNEVGIFFSFYSRTFRDNFFTF